MTTLRDLDYNSLTGTVPTELGELTAMTLMDLKWNSGLCGPIPTELAFLTISTDGTMLGSNCPTSAPTSPTTSPTTTPPTTNH
ncbi:hypothetical protein CYMTET_53503, partial [Cymbomonas tetramitiformis]